MLTSWCSCEDRKPWVWIEKRNRNWCKNNKWRCKMGITPNAWRSLVVWLWVRRWVWKRLSRGQPVRRIAGGWAGGNPWEELLPGEKPVRKNTAGRATREKNCKEPQRAGGNPREELPPGEQPVRKIAKGLKEPGATREKNCRRERNPWERKNTAGRATREKNCKEPQRTEKWEGDVRRVIVSVLMDCDAATSWWWSASLMI